MLGGQHRRDVGCLSAGGIALCLGRSLLTLHFSRSLQLLKGCRTTTDRLDLQIKDGQVPPFHSLIASSHVVPCGCSECTANGTRSTATTPTTTEEEQEQEQKQEQEKYPTRPWRSCVSWSACS